MMITWTELRNEISEQCLARKESQHAAFELAQRYEKLPDHKKQLANKDMEAWLESENSSLRYDAAYVASTCKVSDLVPAMERAISKLSDDESPQAFYEMKKLRRIIDELT